MALTAFPVIVAFVMVFTQWWIDFFQGLQRYGHFDETDYVHRDCLQFCFTHLIQQELDTICHEWNIHRVRKSKDSSLPAGIPNEPFFYLTFTAQSTIYAL